MAGHRLSAGDRPGRSGWVSARADGVRASLKVTPRAARSLVAGIEADAAGRAYLAVRVTAAPDAGKANAAVVKLLARRWRLPGGTLRIVSGASARRKVVQVDGDPDALMAQLTTVEEGA